MSSILYRGFSVLTGGLTAWQGTPTFTDPNITATVTNHFPDAFTMSSPLSPMNLLPPTVATRINLFAPFLTAENGGKKAEDESPAWVKADFTRNCNMPMTLRAIRNDGIKDANGIEAAFKYLSALDLRFKKIVDVIRSRRKQGKLNIIIKGEAKNGAYAKTTFAGLIDRSSEEFGNTIVLGSGSTPDTLLHEMLHVLPFSLVKEIFSGMELPAVVAVDPEGSFSGISFSVKQNMRAHEIFSFGVECLMYDIERKRGATHVFNVQMMSEIYGAWRIGGLPGIATVFPHYLEHYERKQGMASLTIANVIKNQRRADLTFEEYERILENEDGETMIEKQLNLLYRNMREYVRSKRLIVPEDFFSFSIKEMIRAPALKVAELIQAKFDVIDKMEGFEKDDRGVIEAELAPLTDVQMPPADSLKERELLFNAYAGIVDRVLENPPGQFTREEMTSFISFVRMIPPAAALDISRRLQIYIGPDMKDLGVTLGLVVYEKGLKEEGGKIVERYIGLEILAEALPVIKKVMGYGSLRRIIEKFHREYETARRSLIEPFRVWAMDQLLIDGSEVEKDFQELISSPELLTEEGWHSLGLYLVENTDVDYSVEASKILTPPKSFKMGELVKMEGKMLDFLYLLERDEAAPLGTREFAAGVKAGIIDHKRGGISALGNILKGRKEVEKDGDTFASLIGRIASMEYLSRKDVEGLKTHLSKFESLIADSMTEIKSDAWWSRPSQVKRMLEGLLDSMPQCSTEDGMDEAEMLKFTDVAHVFAVFFKASYRKFVSGGRAADDVLARGLAGLADRFVQKMNGGYKVGKEYDRNNYLPDDLLKVWEEADIGYGHVNEHGRYFDVLKTIDFPSYYPNLSLFGWSTIPFDIEPERVLTGGIDFLAKMLEDGYSRISDSELEMFFLNRFFPAFAMLFVQTLERGDIEAARGLMEATFRRVMEIVPPDGIAIDKENTVKKEEDVLWKETNIYEYLDSLRWLMPLAIDRVIAAKEGKINKWIKRLRDEIERGGENISILLLEYFAASFKREGNVEVLERIYRLMMLKSFTLLIPGSADGVQKAFQAVQVTIDNINRAPLPEAKRDELIYSYLYQLFGYITSFRGVDIALVARLKGLFSWRTPFMKAGDPPNYPRSEGFIISKLASVKELVEPQEGKNDRARLGAFFIAGLPLQRYHEWLAHLMAEGRGGGSFGGRYSEGFTTILKGLGLPHPYDIPAKVTHEKALEFLKAKGSGILKILAAGDEPNFDAVLRVLSRVTGSELRDMYKGEADTVEIENAQLAKFILDWLKKNAGNDVLKERVMRVFGLLMDAGPSEVRRLPIVHRMMDWKIGVKVKRMLFDRATSGLIFSSYIRQRIADIRTSASEYNEVTFMKLLLFVRYDYHPGRMPSDFFIEQLEKNAKIRSDYEDYLKGAGENILDPIILIELGGFRSGGDIAGLHWMDRSFLQKMRLLQVSLRFLRRYYEIFGLEGLSLTDRYALVFKEKLLMDRYDDLEPEVKEVAASAGIYSVVEYSAALSNKDYDNVLMEFCSEIVEDILTEQKFQIKLAHTLDELHGLSGIPREEDHYRVDDGDYNDDHVDSDDKDDGDYNDDYVDDDDKDDVIPDVLSWIKRHEEKLASCSVELYRSYMMSLRSDPDIPEFIRNRSGLEQNVLIWAYSALANEQKALLKQQLNAAKDDRERVLHFGKAAHFEKLLQLASVYPSVPKTLQDMFRVFQEDVPHRDKIDAKNTLAKMDVLDFNGKIELDLDRPIKEGTIGGIYKGTYTINPPFGKGGEGGFSNSIPLLFKLQPYGKGRDIDDSLRIVSEIRTGLLASNFDGEGARALDDFLAFYERVMSDEKDLSNEVEKWILFGDFVTMDPALISLSIPEYVEAINLPELTAMYPLYSRRLKDLSPDEREEVFKWFDEVLIPRMAATGHIHFDLHPGNIGVTDDGGKVLYDMGRVHKMTDEERLAMFSFYAALKNKDVDGAIAALGKMGEVWDKEAFKKINGLIERLTSSEDPLRAMEDVYPRLPDYGFRLGDSFVKVLLMHLTWEGTKASFRKSSK